MDDQIDSSKYISGPRSASPKSSGMGGMLMKKIKAARDKKKLQGAGKVAKAGSSKDTGD